jgi:hypothetical protein
MHDKLPLKRSRMILIDGVMWDLYGEEFGKELRAAAADLEKEQQQEKAAHEMKRKKKEAPK